MVTWSNVLEWRGEPLQSAYDDLIYRESTAETLSEELYTISQSFNSEGETVAAANQVVQRRDEADHLEALLSDLLIGLSAAAGATADIEGRVNDAVAFASEERLTIASSGAVDFSPALLAAVDAQVAEWNAHGFGFHYTREQMPDYMRAKQMKAVLQSRVDAIVTDAVQADADYAACLDRIQNGEASALATSVSASGATGNPFEGVDMSDHDAAEIRGLWESLSAEQQLDAIEANPQFIGSLDGVPIDDRIAANSITIGNSIDDIDSEIGAIEQRREALLAKYDLPDDWEFDPEKNPNELNLVLGLYQDEINGLNAERQYFQSLIEGPGGAVLFDRENGHIVEMIGSIDPSNPPSEIMTYVPGTGNTYDSMVHGGSQQVVNYMVDQAALNGESAVGFVYRHEESIGWFGGTANTNSGFLQGQGDEVASFQEALSLESWATDADLNGMGHSAGYSVISGAENAGADFDATHSLAGSFMPGDWAPAGDTEYNHYQYEHDAINYIDAFSNTPNESDDFNQHRFEGGNSNPWNIKGSGDNHSRIAEDSDRNKDALQSMYETMMND